MKTRCAISLALFSILCTDGALARGRLTARITLTGLYYQEEDAGPADAQPQASQARIGLADARLLLDGRSLRDRLDLRLDLRGRVSGTLLADASSFDAESKFQPQLLASQPPVGYRGYLGGPEFLELRELYLQLRLSSRAHLALGRMFIPEADALKADALRLKLRIGEHWEGGVFAGGAPNPYSRYVLTDYDPPCGSGVAQGDRTLTLGSPIAVAPGQPSAVVLQAADGPCLRPGPQLALAAGLTARFQYSRLSGAASLVGQYFDGPGDGGAVVRDVTRIDRVGNLAPASTERDAPRVFASFTSQAVLSPRLSLFSDLVVDLVGTSGAQLTRAALAGTARLPPGDRLTIRLGYSYLSSLAIGMYLRNMLYNRSPNGTTLGGLGVVENNMTVLRTGRHEARFNADLRLARRALAYAEGRVRHRALLDIDKNPDAYADPRYSDNVRSLAGDITVGLRDGGSWRGARGGIAYTLLDDFRARSHLVRLTLGGSLAGELLTIDAEYSALAVTDEGAGQTGCAANLVPGASGTQGLQRINPAISAFLPDCFGRRSGTTHEAGVSVVLSPVRQFALLADYRFTAMLTDPQTGTVVATVLGHGLLVRLEARLDLLGP